MPQSFDLSQTHTGEIPWRGSSIQYSGHSSKNRVWGLYIVRDPKEWNCSDYGRSPKCRYSYMYVHVHMFVHAVHSKTRGQNQMHLIYLIHMCMRINIYIYTHTLREWKIISAYTSIPLTPRTFSKVSGMGQNCSRVNAWVINETPYAVSQKHCVCMIWHTCKHARLLGHAGNLQKPSKP